MTNQFSHDGREFHINDPQTPCLWPNHRFSADTLVNLTQQGRNAAFLQPTGDGFRGNATEDHAGSGGPHVPGDLPKAILTRHFRGASCEIASRREAGVEPGSFRVTVDGIPLEGTLVPIMPAESTCRVNVILG